MEEQKKSRKVKTSTPEEVALHAQACEAIKEFGFSEKFQKLLVVVPAWHNKDENAENKKELIESFGSSEALKDYIDSEEFAEELATLQNVSKVTSILNLVKAFYARRPKAEKAPRVKKGKLAVINIDGELYHARVELINEVKELENKAERVEKLLADKYTTKVEAMVELD